MKRVSHTPKDLKLGSPLPPRVPEGCRAPSGHFVGLREMFTPNKVEAYLIVADGWGAEPQVSWK